MEDKTCRIGFQVQLVSSRLVAWNQAPDWRKAGKKRGRAGEKEKKENKTENETSPGPRKELKLILFKIPNPRD